MAAQVETEDPLIEQARLLIVRLERLSADSIWAHRASGLRGALLRSLDNLERVNSNSTKVSVDHAADTSTGSTNGNADNIAGGKAGGIPSDNTGTGKIEPRQEHDTTEKLHNLEQLTTAGFRLLEKAAQELLR